MSIAVIAEKFAREAHGTTNHLYDGRPYADAHLKPVVDVCRRFNYLNPEQDRDAIEGGAWTHDVIEDARRTWNDVKKACGEQVADIAYALTNEKGKTRKDRANAKYYQGIRNTKYATFVKCCDRIANIEHGIASGGNMVDMYRKEHEHFCAELFTVPLAPMFEHMENILLQPAHTL